MSIDHKERDESVYPLRTGERMKDEEAPEFLGVLADDAAGRLSHNTGSEGRTHTGKTGGYRSTEDYQHKAKHTVLSFDLRFPCLICKR